VDAAESNVTNVAIEVSRGEIDINPQSRIS
jgi:hypothetical protein